MSDTLPASDENVIKKDKTLTEIIVEIDDKYNENLEKLQEELSSAFEIDQFSLVDENMKTVSNLHLWISRHAKEQRVLLKIKRKRDLVYSELFQLYREGKKGHITHYNKESIEAYVTRESEYQKWESYLGEQTILVEYINEICWALKQTKMTALKNIQDAKKLELG
jgi:hypothetical protein